MRLRDVQRILHAEVLWGEDLLDREVVAGFGCDLISDSLFFATPGTLLLTGLTHPQVVRAAELMEFCGVVFVRGKRPADSVVDLARDKGIPLLLTRFLLFDSCGLLYEAGLRGCRAQERR
ncbi:MAG: DRTGG domain-containing protein [Bacillota bacterium]